MAKKMLKHLEIIYRQVESKISASCKEYLQRDNGKLGEYLQRDNGKLGVGMRTGPARKAYVLNGSNKLDP